MKRSRYSACLLFFLMACSRPVERTKVEGAVKYKDQPVALQTLILVWNGDKDQFFTQSIPIKADGSFAGDVRTPGSFRVVIAPSMAALEGRATDQTKIPSKYRERETTDLTWEIQAGTVNKKDFVLSE